MKKGEGRGRQGEEWGRQWKEGEGREGRGTKGKYGEARGVS